MPIFNYSRLWKILIDKNMSKTELRQLSGISTNILAKLGKGEPVSMESLAKIALALNCSLDDIVEVKKDKKRTFNHLS
ncbi:MAG: helix-turn-helix transcriptional regulator [Succinivibrio sp.]|nr:helix-turn-helix transcriptional regulator [Succinivibrio sp.]